MWGRHHLAGEFARDEKTAVGDVEVFIAEDRHLASWIASYLDTRCEVSTLLLMEDVVGHRGGGGRSCTKMDARVWGPRGAE